MDGSGVKVNPTGGWNNGQNKSVTPAACKAALDKVCVGANASATPSSWNRMQMYNVPNGGQGVTTQGFTDYTAEFLLTRGPYAILGCECLTIYIVTSDRCKAVTDCVIYGCVVHLRFLVRVYEGKRDATACKRVGRGLW